MGDPVQIKDIATERTAPVSSDFLAGQTSAGGALSTFKIALATLAEKFFGVRFGGAADGIIFNPEDNFTDAAVDGSVNIGSGSSVFPNRVGVAGSDPGTPKAYALPIGTDDTHSWTPDTAYVGGSADWGGIVGGYDNVVNSVGSFIVGSNHSMVGYGVNGHNLIAGNSYNWIDGAAARSSIVGSRDSAITGGSYNVILAGESCDISAGNRQTIIGTANLTISTGNGNVAIGGSGNTLTGGSFQTLVNGENNAISASGNRNVVIGGSGNVVGGTSGFSAIIGGTNNGHTNGNYSVILGGKDNLSTQSYNVLMGVGAKSNGAGGSFIQGRKLTADGDGQSLIQTVGARTTDATLTNLTSSSGSNGMPLGATTGTVAGTGTVHLVAMNETGDTIAIYRSDVVFRWNYDTSQGYLAKPAIALTATPTNQDPVEVSGASPTLNLDLIPTPAAQLTLGTAPQLRISTGALRLAVTGIAATNIRWVGRLDVVCLTF